MTYQSVYPEPTVYAFGRREPEPIEPMRGEWPAPEVRSGAVKSELGDVWYVGRYLVPHKAGPR